jgi:hypothetical protein
VGRDLDEVEREVVQLLREKGPLRFTEIVESLGADSHATSPKVSRCLRRLVDLGMIRRQVTSDWPPRALYLINIGVGRGEHAQTARGAPLESDSSRKPRTFIFTRSPRASLTGLGLVLALFAASLILLPGISAILVLALVGAYLIWVGFGFETQPLGSHRYLGPIRGWAVEQAAKGRFTVCGSIAACISAVYLIVGIANRLPFATNAVYPQRGFSVYGAFRVYTFQVYPFLLLIAGAVLLGRFVDLHFRSERKKAGIMLLAIFCTAFLLMMKWIFVSLLDPVTGVPGLLMAAAFWVFWTVVYLLSSSSRTSIARAKGAASYPTCH